MPRSSATTPMCFGVLTIVSVPGARGRGLAGLGPAGPLRRVMRDVRLHPGRSAAGGRTLTELGLVASGLGGAGPAKLIRDGTEEAVLRELPLFATSVQLRAHWHRGDLRPMEADFRHTLLGRATKTASCSGMKCRSLGTQS